MAVPGEQESFKSQSFSAPKRAPVVSSGPPDAGKRLAAERQQTREKYFDNRQDVSSNRLDRRLLQDQLYEEFKADPTKTKLVKGSSNLYQAATPGGKLLAEKQMELREAQFARRAQRQGDTSSNPQASAANIARLSAVVGGLRAKIQQYDDQGNPYTYFMGVQTKSRPENSRLLVRGEFDKPAQEIKRGFPQVLVDKPASIPARASGRLELGRWMASEDNPLSARVMVNRVWQHMFGNGIVRSPENFGATGLAPTHPELLDHLARDFQNNDWSVKTLIKKIATSRIYRSDSEFKEASFQLDPENQLIWRMEPRRLEAEVLLDSILRISGDLDSGRPRGSLVAEIGTALVRDGVLISTIGSSNPDVKTGLPSRRPGGRSRMNRKGGMQESASPTSPSLAKIDQPVLYRSVYLPVIRDNVTRSMEVFDFAESSMVIGVRETSNTPDQGLYFLNNQFVIQQADKMAARLIKEESQTKDQIKLAFLLAFGRRANSTELRAAESFYRNFETSRTRFGPSSNVQKLSALCQGILASAEFRFVN